MFSEDEITRNRIEVRRNAIKAIRASIVDGTSGDIKTAVAQIDFLNKAISELQATLPKLRPVYAS
ncbi:hypothetical protein EUV02_03795 [Polymorphobacter arshaanensis]|uniref:Uncharacterized protein n=1 Tax=Glacieibacterium arshaanense TaxID=2511025 RepID=A0A4Y9ERA0_9SPHN|nr:hypothetical protein [Polymorphobacter arshaanensis]TFU06145.1 hypothetical protein EUV02_03795 [Polymorphobacter arshaanensis]